MTHYTPTRLDRYLLVAVELHRCCRCRADCVALPTSGSTFPAYHAMTLKAQLDRSGIPSVDRWRDFGEPVCSRCRDAGNDLVECAICKREVSTSNVTETIGAPGEHLCKFCYEAMPAKDWAEKVAELEERHKYDHE